MATRRNRKNGRFSKTTRRRTRSKALNLTNTAEQLLIANAITHGLFDTNLKTFILPHSMTNSIQWDNSWEITAQELLGAIMGGNFGISDKYRFDGKAGLGAVIRRNIAMNGSSMLLQLITIPIAFKMGKKLLSKPIIRPANRMLKMAGIEGSVKV